MVWERVRTQRMHGEKKMQVEEGGAHPRGKCMLMCPERERIRREKQRQLSVFEVEGRSHDGRWRSSPSRAVKEYIRAGAGQQVPDLCDLRPPPVLVETIEYLVTSILSRTDHPWHTVYNFINNRIQSIRQDITYQQLQGPEITHIYQLASRFYLYSRYRLSAVSIELFDPKLNEDQLQQCLVKLVKQDVSPPTEHAEFLCYYLLTNLGQVEALTHAIELPRKVRHHSRVKVALVISLCFIENNFVRLFREVKRLLPLEECALLPHLSRIRGQALQTLCSAYGSKNTQFPLRLLSTWLGFDRPKAASEFCTACGIEVSEENVLFRRGVFKPPQEPSSPSSIPELTDEKIQLCDLILGT